MAGETGATTNRLLNRLQYALANSASSLAGGMASGDLIPIADVSADYAIKYVTPGEIVGGPTGFIAAGSALTVTAASHAGRIIKLDTAAGSTCTLPAATGSGYSYTFVISVIATSNSHVVKVANSSDTMVGLISTLTDTGNAALIWKASGTDDTITLNRTTTGSTALGEYLVLTDFATNVWLVQGVTAASGTEATPFSATV